MAEFALVGPGDAIKAYSAAVDPTVETKAGWRWLPVEVTNPAFDPATQIQTGPVITVLADKVTRVWTVRTKTAQEQTDENTTRRDFLALQFDDKEAILRAAALVIQDESNLHADRISAILAASASATTLANFKSAMALITPPPQRTTAQMRAAIRAKLGNGI